MDPVWPTSFQPAVVREAFGSRLSSYTIALEAWRRGLTVSAHDPGLRKIRITDDSGHEVTFIRSRPAMTTSQASLTVKDKYRTNELLAASGVPVPASRPITPWDVDAEQLMQLADEIGYPVVLKPRDGARGQGVFSNIADSSILQRRYAELKDRLPSTGLVLERHVRGDDYRVLVFGDEYIAACQRVPANVTGNGESTVDNLIDEKNRHRRKNPFLSSGLIKKDQEAIDHLGDHGMTFDSVPADGQYIKLHSAANASAGGDVVDVTDLLPQSIRDSAIRAVQAIPDLYCAGVDILYDATQTDTAYTVLEINGLPQIGVNMYPTHGSGVDVPRRIVDICFPESKNPRRAGDENLTLSLRPSLQALSSGHASQITFAPLPPSRFKIRRIYDLPHALHLSQAQRTRLLKSGREHAVAGFIRSKRGTHQLMVAGSQASTKLFLESFTSIAGTTPQSPRKWKGTVPSGLTIDL